VTWITWSLVAYGAVLRCAVSRLIWSGVLAVEKAGTRAWSLVSVVTQGAPDWPAERVRSSSDPDGSTGALAGGDPQITKTRATQAIRPILPGLAVTSWRVCQRWDSSAKPRSPRQRAELSASALSCAPIPVTHALLQVTVEG
jgi:hypothetical protein